ncbi:MAG: hypothetical protein HYS13_07285 [Planctomycetia bacterium]|nr:hypothetical protein [Planctomycetia bacterium]
MKPSLRRLLERVIDYAGMFPPARLPLAEAWRKYVENGRSPCAFMQRRFICPAAGLLELAVEIEKSRPAAVEIAAVSRLPSEGDPAAAAKCETTLLLSFIDRMRAAAIAIDLCWEVSYEFPWELAAKLKPPQLKELWDRWSFLDDIDRELRAEPAYRELYFEWPLARCEQGFQTNFLAGRNALRYLRISGLPPSAAQSVSETTARGPQQQGAAFEERRPLRFKYRTGGPKAEDFPSAELLGLHVSNCQMGIAFKCTAGLHHPLRHYDAALGVWQHGFINVLVASVLSSARQLPAPVLEELLEETSPAAFTFTDTKLRWREHSATLAEIDQARSRVMISFGSCSFDEPCQDLRELGWL